MLVETNQSSSMPTQIQSTESTGSAQQKLMGMGIVASIVNKTIPKHIPAFATNNPYTLAEHKEFVEKLDLGQVTAQELQEAFERAVGSEVNLKTELKKLKAAELKHLLRGSFYREEKKDYLVGKVYEGVLRNFSVSEIFSYQPFSETYQDAMRREVSKVTDEEIQQRAKKILERQEFLKKALTNPETKEEFEIFICYRGESKLSAEQKIVWDELNADSILAKKERELAQKAIVSKVNLGDVKLELVEHFHTHRNHNVFIVTMNERVEREVYEELCKKARQLGGNYSKPWKDRASGSVSPGGFMFNDKENAEKFMQLKDSNVSRLDDFKAHQEEVKENAVERLQETAKRMEEKAQELFNRPRLVNTVRRAGMAASVEKEVSKNLALAQTIKNLTENISEGKLKFLNKIKYKTQFELLEVLLIRAKYNCGRYKNERWDILSDREIVLEDIEHAVFPYPRMDFGLFKSAIEVALKVRGANLLAKRLKRWYLKDLLTKDAITLYTSDSIPPLKQLISKLKNSRVRDAAYYAERLSATLVDYDRLEAMNITDDFVLRAALREYLEYRKAHIKPNPIKQMERGLIGQNIPGYFPTPRLVVERMLELAQVEAERKVLEPSAGKGNIADLIREQHPGCYLSVIEINQSLRELLIAKGHELIGNDFLQHRERYSFIIMNPPFEDGQDIEHVRHAYALLYPGGRLVSVMGESAFFRSDKKATEFRNWFESVNGYEEKLANGSFLDSERSTGVNARIVLIDKQGSSTDPISEEPIVGNTRIDKFEVLPSESEITSLESTDIALVDEFVETIETNQGNTLEKVTLDENKTLCLEQYLELSVNRDFLEHQGSYSNMVIEGYDFKHVYHAYGLLKTGGTLRAIINKTVFTSMDKDSILFRKWLKFVGVIREEYPKNTHFVLFTKNTLF